MEIMEQWRLNKESLAFLFILYSYCYEKFEFFDIINKDYSKKAGITMKKVFLGLLLLFSLILGGCVLTVESITITNGDSLTINLGESVQLGVTKTTGIVEPIKWLVTGDSVTYETTDCVDLSKDNGGSPTIKLFGTSPRYAYLKDVYTKQFYFETEAELTELLPDNSPKFGLLVNGKTEMVKFYLDVDQATREVKYVGVVKQPTGGGDDWGGQKRQELETALGLKTGKVKLAVLRNGKDYYFYVNDTLVMNGNDLADENGAAGVFSFNSVVTLGKFKVVQAGDDYQTLLGKAVEDAKVLEGFKLTTNHFEEASKGVYKLTTEISNIEVDRGYYYRVKGVHSVTEGGVTETTDSVTNPIDYR